MPYTFVRDIACIINPKHLRSRVLSKWASRRPLIGAVINDVPFRVGNGRSDRQPLRILVAVEGNVTIVQSGREMVRRRDSTACRDHFGIRHAAVLS